MFSFESAIRIQVMIAISVDGTWDIGHGIWDNRSSGYSKKFMARYMYSSPKIVQYSATDVLRLE